MIPGVSFSPRMGRPQGGHSVLEWDDPRWVIHSLDGTTPGGSFSPRLERLQGGYSGLDRETTPGRLLVLGWNDSSEVIQF